MRKNRSQKHSIGDNGRIYFEGDWYGKGLPGNVRVGKNFYFSSSYGFERIYSKKDIALKIGNEVGLYGQFNFEIGEKGSVLIGDFSIINSARLRCVRRISIGKFCMVAWGTFITDSWISIDSGVPEKNIKAVTENAYGVFSYGWDAPVILEDNVWIGFGCVIMPGVTIGEGSIVASKSVVTENVAPNTVVGGQPIKVLRKLD